MTVNIPIVDRLRACGRRYAGWDKTADIPKKWCIEAADEIDRLRDALGVLVKIEDGDGMAVIGWSDAMKKARHLLGMKDADD